jgi:hypothetical protein
VSFEFFSVARFDSRPGFVYRSSEGKVGKGQFSKLSKLRPEKTKYGNTVLSFSRIRVSDFCKFEFLSF